MKGIRRLFLPQVGMRGPVKHLFEEFQNSLGDRRRDSLDFPLELRESRDGRVQAIVRHANGRGEFSSQEFELLKDCLCELLSEESCAEWLGFNELSLKRPLPRELASFVREPDWTQSENIHKLRMYRVAAFIEFLRPDVLDWQTPHVPHMKWVLEFIGVFTRPGISSAEQTDLILDLSRPQVALEDIVRTERGPRVKLSPAELRYVWETRNLSHEERAKAWDSRTPKPFQPFGRSNLEMHQDKKLTHRWRVAVNHQLDKARALYDSDAEQNEGEAN